MVDFDRVAINTINYGDDTFTVRYIYAPTNSARLFGTPLALENNQINEVAQTGKSIRRAIVADNPKYSIDTEWAALGFKSVILVPLITKGEVIGTLSLRSRQPDAYGSHEQNILERLAKQIAPAVENPELYERLGEQTEAMALVDEVARIINSTLDIEEVYEQCAPEMKKLVDCD